MNKERYQEIIDEAYGNYLNYPLATIHDHRTNILYKNIGKGWCMLNGRSMASPHPTRHLTQEEFINKIKTDPEFSEKWGLKIEERELNAIERMEYYSKQYMKEDESMSIDELLKVDYEGLNIPTKLIAITYNNQTIEIYE